MFRIIYRVIRYNWIIYTCYYCKSEIIHFDKCHWFGLFSFLSKIIKKRTIIWGQERFNSDKDVNKNLIQSFGSIKEIIINSKQNFFIKKLKTFLRLNSVVSVRQLTFVEVPRYFMEFIAIFFYMFHNLSLFFETGYTALLTYFRSLCSSGI